MGYGLRHGILDYKQPVVSSGAAYPTDYKAFWKFEDNLNDESANAYTLTKTGSVTSSYETGKVNKSWYWDGYVSTANYLSNANVKPGANYSVCFWIKTADTADSDMYCNVGGARTCCLRGGGTGYPYAIINVGGWKTDLTISTNIQDGNWHFVSHKRSGDDFYLSIDGGTEVTKNWGSAATESYVLRIGSGAIGGFVNPYYDEFMYFDRCLTASEVLSIYNSGTGV